METQNSTFEKLKESVKKVLSFSQNIMNPHVDELLETWQKNKNIFVNMMDGEYIYNAGPVSFNLDEKNKLSRINSFIDWAYDFYPTEIVEFLEAEKMGLYENKVVDEFVCVDNEVVPVGMRIGKALKRYFSSLITERQLQDLQMKLAQLIQENCISGDLCISCHPLDYLSVSENLSNWRSCHALDGDYCSGNLNYMADNCTMVVYLKNNLAENVVLPHFPADVPWNNKKWRCLLYFDRERGVVWAGRQYPFFADTALSTIVNKVLRKFNFFDPDITWPALQSKFKIYNPQKSTKKYEICYDAHFSMSAIKNFNTINSLDGGAHSIEGPTDTRRIMLNEPYMYIDGRLIALSTLVRDGENTFHYNDLMLSHFYLPYYIQYTNKGGLRKKCEPLTIGEAAPCVSCGKNPIFLSEAMMCAECALASDVQSENITTCACCGERILVNDDYAYESDYYCPDCYNDLDLVSCAICDELTPKADCEYSEKSGAYVCPVCARCSNVLIF